MARPDDAGPEEPDPGRQPVGAQLAAGLHHHVGRDQQAHDRQGGRDPVAAVEHVHRVLVLASADEEDGHDGRQQPEGADHQREEDPGLRVGPLGQRGDGVHADAQDHRADVLGGGRLEQVGATAGAVPDVVADEVRDDRGVARVVLGDALLDLAHEVRADVGGLGVDPAAELGEEGHERGPEAIADDQERRLLRLVEAAEGDEHAVHAQERQGDHQEARHRAAAHGDLDGLDQAAPSGRRRAHVGPDGDEHADDPGRHRARRADQEGDPGPEPEGRPEDIGVGHGLGLEDGDDDADDDRPDHGEDGDRRVLAADERHRALEDRPGDVLHRLGALIPAEDVAGEIDREEDGDQPRREDDQLERLGVHGVWASS